MINQGLVARIKYIVVAIHALLLVSFYWYFRDLPSLDGPVPLWSKYVTDVWAILGIVTILTLFLNQRWGKWLAIIFYSIIALRLLTKAILAFAREGFSKDYLGVYLEFILIVTFLCFPLVLLFERKSKRPNETI